MPYYWNCLDEPLLLMAGQKCIKDRRVVTLMSWYFQGENVLFLKYFVLLVWYSFSPQTFDNSHFFMTKVITNTRSEKWKCFTLLCFRFSWKVTVAIWFDKGIDTWYENNWDENWSPFSWQGQNHCRGSFILSLFKWKCQLNFAWLHAYLQICLEPCGTWNLQQSGKWKLGCLSYTPMHWPATSLQPSWKFPLLRIPFAGGNLHSLVWLRVTWRTLSMM